MKGKNEQLAISQVQDFDWLKRVDGFFVVVKGQLCIVSHPDRNKWIFEEVYRCILSQTFSTAELRRVFSCREVVVVDLSFLSRWRYHEKRLNLATLEKLIQSGIGPAKTLKNKRWKQRLSYLRARYEILKSLFHSQDFNHPLLLQPRQTKDIEKSFLHQQLSFFYGTRSANEALSRFQKSTPFEVIWGKIQPHLFEYDRLKLIMTMLGDEDLSLHSYKKDLARLLSGYKEKRKPLVRDLLQKIYEDSEKRRRDYLSLKSIQSIHASILFPEFVDILLAFPQDNLASILSYKDRSRLEAVLCATRGKDLKVRDLFDLAESKLHRDDLESGYEIVHELHYFKSQSALKRYLRVRRRHPKASILNQEWVMRLFHSTDDWVGNLALSLIAPRKEFDLAGLFTLTSTLLKDVLPEFEEEMAMWDNPTLETRPEGWEKVADALNITTSTVDAYLYYRKILGEGFTFSTALEEPLRLVENEEKQLLFLKKKLKDTPENHKIAEIITGLEDPEGRDKRIEKARLSAQKTMKRAIENMKSDALNGVLIKIAKRVLNRKYGLRKDAVFSSSLLNAFHLLNSERVDSKLLARFFKAIVEGESFSQWPENQKFLTRKREFDSQVWLEGFDIRCGDYRIYVEKDPLEAIKMGSYFDTCLGLENGMNAFSALVNVCDVNKHVIYARNRKGAVVARKLVALDSKNGLLGYHTYMQSSARENLGPFFSSAIEAFADRCALTLVDQGEPEILTSKNWYNDGSQSWSGLTIENEKDPDWEAFYLKASREVDLDALKKVAKEGYMPWRTLAESELLQRKDYRRCYFNRIGFYRIQDCFESPKFRCDWIADAFLRSRGSCEFDSYGESSLIRIDISFSSLGPKTLVSILEKYWKVARALPIPCLVERFHDDCFKSFEKAWRDLFLAAHLSGEDISCVESLLDHRHASVRRIALLVFACVPTPPRKLRKLLKQTKETKEGIDIVRALTLCADQRDLGSIKNLFLKAPSNSVFAYALMLLGQEALVRKNWVFDEKDESEEALALGRSLGPLVTFDGFRKKIYGSDNRKERAELLEKLLQFGQFFGDVEKLDRPKTQLYTHIESIKKGKNDAYFSKGSIGALYGPGVAFSMLECIAQEKEDRRSALFSLLKRSRELLLASYISPGRVVYVGREIEAQKCIHSKVKDYFSLGQTVIAGGDYERITLALRTQEPVRLRALRRLRNQILNNGGRGISMFFENVCNSVVLEKGDAFIEETLRMVKIDDAPWYISTLLNQHDRIVAIVKKVWPDLLPKQ